MKPNKPKSAAAKSASKNHTKAKDARFDKAKSTKPKNPHFYGIHAVTMLLKRRPEDVLSLFIQARDDGR